MSASARAGEPEAERAALSQEEAFARIRLLRSPNIGPVNYARLLRRFGDAASALEALPDLARRTGRPYEAASRRTIEREIAATRAAGARYLFHDSPEYLVLLARIGGAPPILTLRGDLALAAKPCVAIVGARNASAAAVKLAREFGAALAGAGFTVVSGLARGIDGAAHEGAFPATIGVVAGGIDIAYPPRHAALQERMSREALVIAEQPAGMAPRASQFPRRNRIIAGLAMATLVVEAAPRSGSLITARLAVEAGREVMAIPGSPLESRSHGCNHLIREGATLVQTPEDVLELLQGFDGKPRAHFHDQMAPDWEQSDEESLCWPDEPAPLDEGFADESLVEKSLGDELKPADIASLLTSAPISIDELIRQSGASPSAIQLALLELEIAGMLERHAGARVSLIAG